MSQGQSQLLYKNQSQSQSSSRVLQIDMEYTNESCITLHDQDLNSLNQINEVNPNNEETTQSIPRYVWVFIFILIAAILLMTYQYFIVTKNYGLIKQDNISLKNKISDLNSKFTKCKSQKYKLKTVIQSNSQPKEQKNTLTVPKIRPDMAQLSAISQKRIQKPGMIQTPKGTACQLRQLMKNKQGLGVEDVLYGNEDIKAYRQIFVNKRIELIRNNEQIESIGLCKYTIKLNEEMDDQQTFQDLAQYQRIREIHHLDKYSQELPMCIVVPSFNNNARFRIEFNLNSIFLQNYTNYFAVIINDASTDGSDQLFRNYFNFYNINKDRYIYVNNINRLTAMQNIYTAIMQYCSNDSIIINLDGDDELIGKNVLKIINANYQSTKMGIIYSNYLRYRSDDQIQPGWTKDYSEHIKQHLTFRDNPQYFSHLKTYRAELFRLIPKNQFEDQYGNFYKITSDMAIFYPLMEVACGKVLKIQGFHYLYNFNTGLNDYKTNHQEQLKIQKRIRNRNKLKCSSQFSKN